MKRYITFVLVAMSLVGLVACSNDNGIAAPDGEAQVALRFESSSMTRADDVAGINDLNENLIKTIDCYFYPANATEDTQAVWHQKFDFVDEDNGIAGKQSTATVTDILMPSSEMNAIFGQGTTGKIYAIANYAGGNALPTSGENTTVAKLKDMVVTTAWLDTNSKFQKQLSFVMDSEMVEITKSADNTISGTVPLFRTAAKVELTITGVAESAKDAEGNVWVPNITVANGVVTGANVTMYNARTTSSVGGDVQDFKDGTHPELTGYGFSTSTVAGALYKQTNPFYTYPHTWESSEQEAYLLLVVNWKKQSDNNTTASCYYEIPIGAADNKEIVRNHIYQIGINVGTLGSFVKEDPVLLTPSYMVVDWGTGDISAKIKGQRYLVVDKKKIEIFNQTDCKVNFSTSHVVNATILSITRPDFTNEDELGTEVIYSYDLEDGTSSGSTDNFALSYTDGVLSVAHTLQNDTTKEVYDYAPYTITVRIYHQDAQTTFYEDVTFIQYPAMYISLEKNEGGNSIYDSYYRGNRDKGFVFVYGNQYYQDPQWSAVRELGTSTSNSNPNMYIITISALNNSAYIIGDPREENSIEGSSISLSKTDASGSKTLDNYYPTRTDDAAKNIIAPKFRIASSYGKCGSSIDYDEAERRCAAYQEYGRPAGRWRVPTMAEVRYIAELSSDRIFPHLFGDNDYWAAQGGFKYSINDNNNVASVTEITSGDYVRCVYDEWYWTDTCDKGTFTWGDMPR